MRITDQKKEEIRQAADIVEVIGRYVELKKRGSNYMGLSPFKQEKTPSFSVNPRLNIFKDFSSGIGGDVFKFLMEVEGWTFMKAVEFLAEMYHVPLPQENAEQQAETERKEQQRSGIMHALEFAAKFYTQQLYESAEAEPARKYIRERKITKKALVVFGLGYAPKSGQALRQAAEKAQLNTEYLLKAGLIKEKDGNGEGDAFDFFRGRLIFPIMDTNGRVIAFAGRILGKQKGPKYINSAESEVYHKSKVLYGMQEAKHEIRKLDECLLVEGYTDVISLWQQGIKHAVASSGTALTEAQLKLIARYGKKLCMNYDGDAAGRNAMKRGIQLAFDASLSVQILQLPESEDPDSYVKTYGAESFLRYKASHQTDFIRYLVNEAKLTGKWSDPQGQSDTISEILAILATIKDDITKATSLNTLAEVSGIGTKLLEERMALIQQELHEQENRRKAFEAERKRREVSTRNDSIPLPDEHLMPYMDEFEDVAVPAIPHLETQHKLPFAEKEVLRLLMTYGQKAAIYLFEYLEPDLFSHSGARALFEAIHTHFLQQKDFNDIEMGMDDKFGDLVVEVFFEKERPSDHHFKKTGSLKAKDIDLFHSFRSAIHLMAIKHLEREKIRIAKALNETSDPKMRQQLVNEDKLITKQRTELDTQRLKDLFPVPESMPAKQKQEGFVYRSKLS